MNTSNAFTPGAAITYNMTGTGSTDNRGDLFFKTQSSTNTSNPLNTGAAAGLEAGPVRLRAQLQPGRACFPKPSAAEPRPRQFDMQVVTVRSIVIGSQHRAKPLAGALVNGRQEPPHGSVVA